MIEELMRQVNSLQRQIDSLVKPEISPRRLVVIIQDQKASGTDGGTFTSGAWRTRVLNTTVYSDLAGYSLASNQFTLPAGTYFVTATAPAYLVNYHAARLYNATDAAVIMSGTSEFSYHTGPLSQTRSFIVGNFTLAASKALEIQHRCSATSATFGFGVAAGSLFAVGTEIYTEARIWLL